MFDINSLGWTTEQVVIAGVAYGFVSGLVTAWLAFPPAWLHRAANFVFGTTHESLFLYHAKWEAAQRSESARRSELESAQRAELESAQRSELESAERAEFESAQRSALEAAQRSALESAQRSD